MYDLDNCPKIRPRKFTLKNCLSGVNNIGENSDKSKWVYRGYGIVFDGKGGWIFGNDSLKNVVIFGGDNSSSSGTDNDFCSFKQRRYFWYY